MFTSDGVVVEDDSGSLLVSRLQTTPDKGFLNWSERRCADRFVETAVGHYFWYFSFLVLVLVVLTAVAKMA